MPRPQAAAVEEGEGSSSSSSLSEDCITNWYAARRFRAAASLAFLSRPAAAPLACVTIAASLFSAPAVGHIP